MATYSKSLTVAAKNVYTLTMDDIPVGASVTPVNDIQIWLHCANIWSKTYTTINQVLADASTLQALIASNNAADYMARSTNWASSVCADATAMTYIGNNSYCANKLLANSTWKTSICNSSYFENVLTKKIPTMTSNTTPSGTASSTNTYNASTHGPWKTFDGVDTTACLSAQNTSAPWEVKYTFASNYKVYKVKAITSSQYNTTSTIKIQVLDASTNSWVDVGTISRTSSTGKVTNNYILSTPITASAIRAYYTASPDMYGEYVNILQAWGRAS